MPFFPVTLRWLGLCDSAAPGPLGPAWWGCVCGSACAPVRPSVPLLCVLADALYLVLVFVCISPLDFFSCEGPI